MNASGNTDDPLSGLSSLPLPAEVPRPRADGRGTAADAMLSIAAVERDTGLSKDTLRIWERRYGFPAPLRDAFGERLYPVEQLERLRLIKRLLDAGHRPGRVVGMAAADLTQLSAEDAHRLSVRRGTPAVVAEALDLVPCLELLRAHDILGLRQRLVQAQMSLGLSRFVTEMVAPLNAMVGDAWMRGQMEIFEEHLYTESVHAVLRNAIGAAPQAGALPPRVLLTTLPGEPHSLGLLMAEAMFVIGGCHCLSMGTQTPVWDIVLAARAQRADVVGLSFSGCMNPNQVVDSLAELRLKLPASCEVWAGGSAPVLHRRPVAGVLALAALPAVLGHVERWRATRP